MGEVTPSENEWAVMEIVWKQRESVTAAKIIEELQSRLSASQKTVRVMINRLVAKGLLGYTVDERDSRVYHYFPLKAREECLRLKKERFIKKYFNGNATLAVASFLESADISKEQFQELSRMVEQLQEKK